jgi:hypothetical protein
MLLSPARILVEGAPSLLRGRIATGWRGAVAGRLPGGRTAAGRRATFRERNVPVATGKGHSTISGIVEIEGPRPAAMMDLGTVIPPESIIPPRSGPLSPVGNIPGAGSRAGTVSILDIGRAGRRDSAGTVLLDAGLGRLLLRLRGAARNLDINVACGSLRRDGPRTLRVVGDLAVAGKTGRSLGSGGISFR